MMLLDVVTSNLARGELQVFFLQFSGTPKFQTKDLFWDNQPYHTKFAGTTFPSLLAKKKSCSSPEMTSLALVDHLQALETSPKRQQTAKSTPASRFRNREAMERAQVTPEKSSSFLLESHDGNDGSL